MTANALYMGHVMHRRLRPSVHQLRYRIFSLLLDLDELDELDCRLRFFSRGRFNLLSFHDRDHGDGSTTPLREQALAHLQNAGVAEVGRIRLLAMPRVLGFVFNPLSVYFCERQDGGLAAILYEVHNTFKERHIYVLPVEDGARPIGQDVAKRFYVSPFLPMSLHYVFRVRPPAADVRIAIAVVDCEGPILTAVHSARALPLSDVWILRAVASLPLMTFKVVAGILWEAGKLKFKGVAIHPHPRSPAGSATIREARTTSSKKAA